MPSDAKEVIDHLQDGCRVRSKARLTGIGKTTGARLLRVSGCPIRTWLLKPAFGPEIIASHHREEPIFLPVDG